MEIVGGSSEKVNKTFKNDVFIVVTFLQCPEYILREIINF